MSQRFDFTVVLDGVRELSAEQAERLYGRCRDATESEADGVVRVSFSRKAPTFADAVRSALADLRRCGLRAARVETEELVSAAEIAKRMGRSRESVRLLIEGERGPGDFPALAHTVGERFRLWRWPEVEAWFARYERRAPRTEDQQAVVDAVNLILALRTPQDALGRAERRALARVAEEERSLATVG